MTNSAASLTITHCHARRTCRVGACPVLEVTVTYPALCSAAPDTEELPPSVTRFNEAYRTMAENLLEWAQGSLCEAAMADFNAAGAGAAYRFDRRMVVCNMTASCPASADNAEAPCLIVTRTLRMTSRRGEVPEKRLVASDLWRWPELTLCPAGRRRGRRKLG